MTKQKNKRKRQSIGHQGRQTEATSEEVGQSEESPFMTTAPAAKTHSALDYYGIKGFPASATAGLALVTMCRSTPTPTFSSFLLVLCRKDEESLCCCKPCR